MSPQAAHSGDNEDSAFVNSPGLPAGLPPVFAGLAARMGPQLLSERLNLQASHWAGLHHQGEGILAIERFIPLDTLVDFALRITGLAALGLRGARDLRLEQNLVKDSRVPQDLDGFRILQLSDLHLDLDTGLMPRLLEMLAATDYDLAVITGDYRNSTTGDFVHSLAETAEVLRSLKPPVYGILGNHDCIEMVPPLQEMGLQLLLNEWVEIPRGSAKLVLAGIDDPHFYKTHDLAKASQGPAGPDTFRILLSHSPETYQEASGLFDLQLSGHTHGGQICLPGGIPVIRNGNCPASMISGSWKWESAGRIMHGYTSRGTGCCGVPARIFCPPEITLHTLKTV